MLLSMVTPFCIAPYPQALRLDATNCARPQNLNKQLLPSFTSVSVCILCNAYSARQIDVHHESVQRYCAPSILKFTTSVCARHRDSSECQPLDPPKRGFPSGPRLETHEARGRHGLLVAAKGRVRLVPKLGETERANLSSVCLLPLGSWSSSQHRGRAEKGKVSRLRPTASHPSGGRSKARCGGG